MHRAAKTLNEFLKGCGSMEDAENDMRALHTAARGYYNLAKGLPIYYEDSEFETCVDMVGSAIKAIEKSGVLDNGFAGLLQEYIDEKPANVDLARMPPGIVGQKAGRAQVAYSGQDARKGSTHEGLPGTRELLSQHDAIIEYCGPAAPEVPEGEMGRGSVFILGFPKLSN